MNTNAILPVKNEENQSGGGKDNTNLKNKVFLIKGEKISL